MLKQVASFVLASLQTSTYFERTPQFFVHCGLAGSPFERLWSLDWTAWCACGWVLAGLNPSLKIRWKA